MARSMSAFVICFSSPFGPTISSVVLPLSNSSNADSSFVFPSMRSPIFAENAAYTKFRKPSTFCQFDSTLFFVGCSTLKDTVSEDQDLMRYGHHCFGPALSGNPPKAVLQIAAFLLRYTPRTFCQCSSQPPVALSRVAGLISSCAFVVPRTQTGPRTQVLLVDELLGIRSHLRQ